MSSKKLTLWRDVEHIKYVYEMNINCIFQFIFSHSFITFFSKYFMNINWSLFIVFVRWLRHLKKIAWLFWLKSPISCGYQSWLSLLYQVFFFWWEFVLFSACIPDYTVLFKLFPWPVTPSFSGHQLLFHFPISAFQMSNIHRFSLRLNG